MSVLQMESLFMRHNIQGMLERSSIKSKIFSRDSTADRRKKSYVTALIGFATNSRIILASDSQLTFTGYKQPDAPKIFKISKGEKPIALIAVAGIYESASLFKDLLERKLENTEITEGKQISALAGEAIVEVSNSSIGTLPPELFPQEIRQQAWRDRNCWILLGYYFNDKPFIYKLSFLDRAPVPLLGDFYAEGIGSAVATYALAGFGSKLKGLEPIEAINLSVYAIKLCTEYADGCDGKCQVGVIERETSLPIIIERRVIALSEQAAFITDQQSKAELLTKLQSHWMSGPDPLESKI